MEYVPYVLKLIPLLLVVGAVLGVVPFLVFLERKICAFAQDRVGPNRVGLLGPGSPLEIFGLQLTKKRFLGGWLQPVADAVKLFAKESFIPAGAEKPLFLLAPVFAMLPPFLSFVVIPIAPDLPESLFGKSVIMQVADLNIGILWVLSVASLSAYGLAFGGWASNNKYALLGGVRATAQMISYEIGLGILILSVVMSYGTVSLHTMVLDQVQHGWGIVRQPLAFVLFVICAFAENNRLPFDLPECEAELIGGYHTEYNSMSFGMFFQGEYIAMLAMGALTAALFLGGWHYPGYSALSAAAQADHSQCLQVITVLLGLLSFGLKTFGFVLFSIWVRWTLPRFRWDQLMRIGWRGVVPLALANLLLTAFVNLRIG